MGVFDNLANRFHLGDSEDDYDDEDEMDDYEDDDDYEDESPRVRNGGGLFGNGGRRNGRARDDEDEEDEPAPRPNGRTSLRASQNQRSTQLAPMRSRGGMSGGKMQVRIIKPSSFDQARQITDTLLSQRTFC